MPKQKRPDESLKGWAAIAKFLGQPVPTVQRWATEGMPLTRIGRYVAASPAEWEGWLTREASAKETVHIPSAKAWLVESSQSSPEESTFLRAHQGFANFFTRLQV